MATKPQAKPVSARRLLAALVLAFTALIASAPESFAQDPFSELFGDLFGAPRRARRAPPDQPRVRRIMPHQENRPPTYWRGGDAAHTGSKRARRNEAPSQAGHESAKPRDRETAKSEAPEAAATYFVAAMGDTLGGLLAGGLEESFADKPEIGILRKSKENSGLVRDDFYDWPKVAKEIANGPQKIDVAVMMIGANDRQPIQQGAKSEEPFSPKWREIYRARVDAVLAAFRDKKIPVVWVGLPIMKSESFSVDMAKLNEIFREAVGRAGGVYVDLWEALADDRGQFSAFGPDINGQIVKLRTADGVHLTDAGALSVAHFVSGEIKKLYEERKPPTPEAPAPAAASPAASGPPSAPPAPAANAAPIIFTSPIKPAAVEAPALPQRPDIGAVQSLGAASVSGAAELARRRAAAAPTPASADPQALARHVFMEGGDQPARANRADDYSWKPTAP